MLLVLQLKYCLGLGSWMGNFWLRVVLYTKHLISRFGQIRRVRIVFMHCVYEYSVVNYGKCVGIITPSACERGKVIVLSVVCRHQ